MNKPKDNIETPSQMLVEARERRLDNRMYNRSADSGVVVSAIVEELATELANVPQKIDLKNTELVRSVLIAYTDACSKVGLIPSKIGAARAMGISRRAVDYFMEKHAEHPTAQMLEIFFDAYSEALSSAALANATNNVFSIFLSKALYRYKDTYTVESAPKDPIDEYAPKAEDIVAKYRDLLPED